MNGNRKALCVGINVYKNYPDATLRGCVNDVENLSSVLRKYMGFMEKDIIKLIDAQATKENILSNLKSMIAEARAGRLNYLVFSLSSHGTQIPDHTGEERDRADEAFCPTDLAQSGNHWDKKHLIIDDELHELMLQIPQEVVAEVFLDTCHSGDGLRAVDLLMDRKPRYLPPPSLEAFLDAEPRQLRGLDRMMSQKEANHQILWAACRSDQTSADAHIGGTWNGAFTYFFCKLMNQSQNKLPRRELLQRVRVQLKADHFTQTPQLECQASIKDAIPPLAEKAAIANA